MADNGFEVQLQSLFDAAPPAPDADAFARAVDARLDQIKRMRRWVYGLFGGAGALVAAVLVARSNLGAGLVGAQRGIEHGLGQAMIVDLTSVAAPTWTWAAVILAAVGIYLTGLLREE